jgi:hypothetical protein
MSVSKTEKMQEGDPPLRISRDGLPHRVLTRTTLFCNKKNAKKCFKNLQIL